MSESNLVRNLMNHLRNLDRPSHAQKIHGSQFMSAGEPDIDACVDGRAVKVEAKMPGNTPTPIQYASMRRWERAGALVGWVTSVDELRLLLGHLDDPDWRNPQIAKDRDQRHLRLEAVSASG